MELGGPERIWRTCAGALRGLRNRAGRSVATALVVAASAWPNVLCADQAAAGIVTLLRRADAIKTSDHSAFVAMLADLGARRAEMTAPQSRHLGYLQAWDRVYSGDYGHGIPALEAISDGPGDVTLRFRAGMTVVNALVIARRYADAYTRLSRSLAELPGVSDRGARLQGIGVAAFLYDEAGQYDLAVEYANRLLAEPLEPTAACKGTYLRLDARVRRNPGTVPESDLRAGIARCESVHEPLWANLIVVLLADADIEHRRTAAAVRLLREHEDEVRRTHYPRLISEFDALLGKASWQAGDAVAAAAFAHRAAEEAVAGAYTKPLVDAYRILYQAAASRRDFRSALDWHEKYLAADNGYLDDRSARTLAFQMVDQQVRDDKHRVVALNETNSMLRLRGQLAQKAAEIQKLYLALLLLALACVMVWAFRAKRSQIHFERLSRRDGLTGILNRQQFMDEAKAMLRQCAKASHDAALILIDLDHFKSVNDVHGHVAGDAVLQQAVTICLKHMRHADVFGRVGGEEFGVLLPQCGLGTACERAEALRRAIAAHAGGNLGIPVSASLGVVSSRQTGYELRHLLIDADRALYRAKRGGRNRVESAPHAASVPQGP